MQRHFDRDIEDLKDLLLRMGAMVEDAAWVFLLQQVDIYATRDRLTWTPRPDQWLQLR